MKRICSLTLYLAATATLLATSVQAYSGGAGGAGGASAAIAEKINALNDVINPFISNIMGEFNAQKDKYANRCYSKTYKISSTSSRTLGSYGIERICAGFADASTSGTGNTNTANFLTDPTAASSSTTSNTGFTNNLINYSSTCALSCPNPASGCTLKCDCPHDYSDKFVVQIDFLDNTSINDLPINNKKLLFVAVSSGGSTIDKSSISSSDTSSTSMADITRFNCVNVKGTANDGINGGSRYGEMIFDTYAYNLGSTFFDSGSSQAGFAGCFSYPNFRDCNVCNVTELKTCS